MSSKGKAYRGASEPNNKLVIIAITTHGGIPINPQGKVSTYTIPEGMTFTKLSAVVHGVCNLASDEDTENALKSILENIRNFAGGELKTKAKLVSSVAKCLKEQSREVVRDTASSQLKEAQAGSADAQCQDFVRMAGGMYRIATKISGEAVIDKIYTRSASEVPETPWELKIHLLTEHGFPDIMQEILGRRSGRGSERNDVVYLHDIINKLTTIYRSQQLDIVLVDLTCSVFGDFETDFTQPGMTEIELTQRAQRLLRRHLFKEGLFGGKRKKLKRNKKTKVNKKGRGRKTAKTHA
jgi:hypothetical protein